MAIAFVQSKSATGSSTSATLTFTAAPTSGNLLVSAVSSSINAVITMPAGWNPLTSVATGTTSAQVACRIFWKQAIISESASPAATVGSGAWAIAGAEYSSLGHQVVVDTQNAQSNAAAASQPTPSVTPRGGEQALIFCFSGNRGTSATFSAETIGGTSSGVTEREDTAQGTLTANMCIYDAFIPSTNGAYAGGSTSAQTNVVGGGGIAIFTTQEPPLNNYQFVTVGDGMSTGEKIR